MGRTKVRSRQHYLGRRKKSSMNRVKKPASEVLTQTASKQKNMSATGKKFSVFGVEIPENQEKQEDQSELDECYLIVQKSCLSQLLSLLLCPECLQPCVDFEVLEEKRAGFSVQAKLHCSNCEMFSIEKNLCERVGNSKSQNVPWDINIRAILAFRGIGCGYSAMRDWAGVMNMPYTLSRDAYATGHQKIEKSSAETFSEMNQTARTSIEKAYNEIGVVPDQDGILNVAVSYDGSWQKRGYTSHNGMSSVIELITGIPLDYEVMSNFCFKCKAMDAKDNNHEQIEKHMKNCPKNFDGTASAMEAEGARRLWKRSVEKNKMRYTTILCDGDSKAFDAVTELEVYGKEVKIEKEDCINHVSKRMGTALRNLVSESKARKESVAGKGKLTLDKIGRIQNYYGRAIKDHSTDIQLLKKRIMAILLHLSSTDKTPQHLHCPPGEKSWCFWQRALATSKEPGTHKEHETLPYEIGKKLVPIFKRLSDEDLLKRCSRSMTQNANESLHNLIWRLCPKATFVGKRAFHTAVSLAMCQFSMGATFRLALCKALNIVPGEVLVRAAIRKSAERLKKAEKASTEQSKKLRKALKYSKQQKEKAKKSQEGSTYAAGAFDY